MFLINFCLFSLLVIIMQPKFHRKRHMFILYNTYCHFVSILINFIYDLVEETLIQTIAFILFDDKIIFLVTYCCLTWIIFYQLKSHLKSLLLKNLMYWSS